MDLYSRVRILGKGSFGAAWLVQRNTDKTFFVAKEIRIADLKLEDMKSALNEVAILRTLDHPNVVHYVDHFECDGTMFLIMEYAGGGDLHSTIKARRGVLFSEREVLHYFAQVCLAIAHLHERRILHRDLKTHNIFLTHDGVVKLGDFGISTVLRSTFELRKTVCGTPYYFSPELCLNRPYNNKSDVWALGCTLYELLTLKHAFEGTTFQTLAQKILKGSYPPIDGCFSPQLSRLVSQMLQTDPHRRPNVSQIIGLPFIQEALARLQRGVQRTAADGEAICAASNSPLHSAPSSGVRHAKCAPVQVCTPAGHVPAAQRAGLKNLDSDTNNHNQNHSDNNNNNSNVNPSVIKISSHINYLHDNTNDSNVKSGEAVLARRKALTALSAGDVHAEATRGAVEERACREFLSLSPYATMTLEEFAQLDHSSQQVVLRGMLAGRARRESDKSHMEQKLEAARRYQMPCGHPKAHSENNSALTPTSGGAALHVLPLRNNAMPSVNNIDNSNNNNNNGLYIDKKGNNELAKVAPSAVRELYRQNRQQMQVNRQRCTGQAINSFLVPPERVHDVKTDAIANTSSPAAVAIAAPTRGREHTPARQPPAHRAAGANSKEKQDSGVAYVGKHMSQKELEEARWKAYRQMQDEAKENKLRLMSQPSVVAAVSSAAAARVLLVVDGTESAAGGRCTESSEPAALQPVCRSDAADTSAMQRVQQTQNPPLSSARGESVAKAKPVEATDIHTPPTTAQDETAKAIATATTTPAVAAVAVERSSKPVAIAEEQVSLTDKESPPHRKIGDVSSAPHIHKERVSKTTAADTRMPIGGAADKVAAPTNADTRLAVYDALDSVLAVALHPSANAKVDDSLHDCTLIDDEGEKDVYDGDVTEKDVPQLRFVLDGKTLKLPNVGVRDPLMHRIETLRVFLETNMGEEALISCYRAMSRISVTDEAAVQHVTKSLPQSVWRFVPLVAQLIGCEDSFNRQGRP